jgi:hypothetical protein
MVRFSAQPFRPTGPTPAAAAKHRAVPPPGMTKATDCTPQGSLDSVINSRATAAKPVRRDLNSRNLNESIDRIVVRRRVDKNQTVEAPKQPVRHRRNVPGVGANNPSMGDQAIHAGKRRVIPPQHAATANPNPDIQTAPAPAAIRKRGPIVDHSTPNLLKFSPRLTRRSGQASVPTPRCVRSKTPRQKQFVQNILAWASPRPGAVAAKNAAGPNPPKPVAPRPRTAPYDTSFDPSTIPPSRKRCTKHVASRPLTSRGLLSWE